jgi:hypothetical protein
MFAHHGAVWAQSALATLPDISIPAPPSAIVSAGSQEERLNAMESPRVTLQAA